MGGTRPVTPHQYHASSPVAAMWRRIAAELGAGVIPATCTHPATAEFLRVPSMALRCAECLAGEPAPPDSQPGPCASCGGPGGCLYITWLDEDARVLVTARICPGCMRAGNLSLVCN
jgi:hypothetical protein